jgi:hypothetical protein
MDNPVNDLHSNARSFPCPETPQGAHCTSTPNVLLSKTRAAQIDFSASDSFPNKGGKPVSRFTVLVYNQVG